MIDLQHDRLVVMQHPVTTEYYQSRAHVLETLHAVTEAGLPTLWFWPNVDAGADGTSNAIRTFREQYQPPNIHFFKNMAPTDFLRVVVGSACIVGNSSVGIRECSFLGVPAVNIGSRQEGRERGANVLDVGYDREQISAAIEHHRVSARPAPDPLYGDGKAGDRIANCLAEVELRYEKKLAY
jgi:UDP-N-acetylglucosamine 2-epimerase